MHAEAYRSTHGRKEGRGEGSAAGSNGNIMGHSPSHLSFGQDGYQKRLAMLLLKAFTVFKAV